MTTYATTPYPLSPSNYVTHHHVRAAGYVRKVSALCALAAKAPLAGGDERAWSADAEVGLVAYKTVQ